MAYPHNPLYGRDLDLEHWLAYIAKKLGGHLPYWRWQQMRDDGWTADQSIAIWVQEGM